MKWKEIYEENKKRRFSEIAGIKIEEEQEEKSDPRWDALKNLKNKN